MLIKRDHSPDAFMFRSFDIHSRVFRNGKIDDYFMISSGTNQFSMPRMWKEAIRHEIESDFLYRWYTCDKGFQSITSAIKIYEDYISGTNRRKFTKSARDICMAIGGSCAASMVFAYLKYRYGECHVILAGFNYSLYERLSLSNHFTIDELHTTAAKSSIPRMEDFQNFQNIRKKIVFIFSIPNNPTGESYSLEEFSKILSKIKNQGAFIILDQTCNIIMTNNTQLLLESAVTQNDYWSETVVVNSFSKTESIAGIRIGYVYGNREIIRFCSDFNAKLIMNPPTIPAFPIVLTCLYRCLYLNDKESGNATLHKKFLRLFHDIFFMTAAIVPKMMRDYANQTFDSIDVAYHDYVKEQLHNESIMQKNFIATYAILKKHIKKASRLDNGFNFCVWFRKPFRLKEIDLIRSLIDRTGIAILTESSFSLQSPKDKSFFIRFSTACEYDLYENALLRLNDYFEKEGFEQ